MRFPAFASRNFTLNFADGVFFSAGTAFFAHAGLLPLFVATLTDARWPLGLVTPVLMVGLALPQLLGAALAASQPNFWRTIVAAAVLPRVWVAVLVLVPWVPPPWTLAAFFAVWALYALSLGLCMPIWVTFIAQVLPPEDRGKFFGGRTTAGGLMAMAGAAAASALLAAWPGRLGFSLCFLCAAVLLTLSLCCFLGTRHDWRDFEAQRPRGNFLRDAVATIRAHQPFRTYMLARVCATATVAAIGFYAVHGVQTYHLTTAQGSLLALAIVFVPNLTAAFWGLLADRVGNRLVQIPALAVAGVANVVLALTPPLPVYVLCLVAAGFATVINQLVDNKLMMEIDRERCGTLLGVLNLALTPGMLVLPVAAGVLAEVVGVPAVFVATGVALWLAAGILVASAPERGVVRQG